MAWEDEWMGEERVEGTVSLDCDRVDDDRISGRE